MRFGFFKRVKLGEILPIGICWSRDYGRRPRELCVFIVLPVDIRPVEEYKDESRCFFYYRGRRLTLVAVKICIQVALWHKPIGKQEETMPWE